MPRYIDADIAIEEIDKLQESLKSNNDTIWKKNKPIYKGLCNARGIINDTPTADVIPKSEVVDKLHEVIFKKEDLMQKIAEERNKYFDELETAKDNNEHLAVMLEEAKSEVERLQEEANRYKRYFFRHDYDEMISEVLDELDRFIKSNCIEIKDERGIKGYITSGVHFAIAELKKKYTDGEDKPASEEKYFSPGDVAKMTHQEVREKYTAIRKSMKRW